MPAPDSLSSYARVPVDPYAGYSTYQPELLPPPRYAASARAAAPTFRPRQRLGQKKKPPPAQNLGPKKKAFKQTQKINFSVEKVTTPKKALQKKSLQGEKKEAKSEIKAGKPQKSQAESLAKETQELHSLYRTGVDPTTGKKFDGISVKKADASSGKNNNSSVAGKKRKAEPQKESTTEAPASEKKKLKRKKNKKLAKGKKLPAKKDQKPAASTPVVAKAVKTEVPPLSEEEKKEVEASLELQRGMCKSVGEFLGVPCAGREPENKEAADADGSEGKPAEALKPEEAQKSEEAPKIETLTPEEEKEHEEKGFQFFSKILEENQDLRKLYIDKCNAGTFECLVCHTVDAETSKKFGNLTSLVMHASMRKQKRPEHRGYGRAVCSVLGWEPLKTPRPPRVNKDTPASDGSTKEEKEGGKPASQSETGEKATEASDIEAANASEEGITEDPAKDSVAE